MNRVGRSELDEKPRRSSRKEHSFFSGLSASVLQDFAAVRHVALYPRNSILFAHEQEPRGIYIICSGRVKLWLSSRDGRILTLRLARPGEALGLSQLLLGKDSQVTAEVLYPCEIELVIRSDFLRILSMHPCVFKNVARELALQHEAACEQIRTVGLGLSIRDKLGRFLLHWISEKQVDNGNGPVDLPLNHEEIAACIGATREPVTRVFRKFKSLGLVERQGYAWVIPRPALLRKFVISETNSREFGALRFDRRASTHSRVRTIQSGQFHYPAQRKRGLA